jgi:hypothetical protein
MPKGDPKDEYLDVSENIRHWANIRQQQWTVFIAIIAALIALLFQPSATLTSLARFAMKVAGMLIVIIFWVMDERVMKYWDSCRHRACVLEKELEFQQYLTTPSRGIITSKNAVRLLYFLVLVFWLLAMIGHSQF